MIAAADFFEANGFVKLEGGQRRIDVNAVRTGGHRCRFGGSEQRGANPKARDLASDINRRAVRRTVERMGRKPQHLRFVFQFADRRVRRPLGGSSLSP